MYQDHQRLEIDVMKLSTKNNNQTFVAWNNIYIVII